MRRPTSAPFTKPGTGSATHGIMNPIAKRLANAAINAARLLGKAIGSMSATANTPNPMPQIKESTTGFIRVVPWLPLILQRFGVIRLRGAPCLEQALVQLFPQIGQTLLRSIRKLAGEPRLFHAPLNHPLEVLVCGGG